MTAPSPAAGTAFRWDDAPPLEERLADEERMVRDSARACCLKELAPHVSDIATSRRRKS